MCPVGGESRPGWTEVLVEDALGRRKESAAGIVLSDPPGALPD